MLELVTYANQWQIPGLARRLEGLLLGAMDIDNCVSLLNFAEAHFLDYLRTSLMSFIERNWQLLRKSECFAQLSPGSISELEEALRSKTCVYSHTLASSGASGDTAAQQSLLSREPDFQSAA